MTFIYHDELYAPADQLGALKHQGARLAEDAGLKVVMNRCPKIELFRPFWKPRLDLKI